MIAPIQNYLKRLLSEKITSEISSMKFQPVGGGSINDTYQLIINNNIKFFLKINSATKYPALFEKEKKGLDFIKKQNIVDTPSVIASEITDTHQLLLTEWIEGGLKTEEFWKNFGKQLASLHQITGKFCGFEEDNYMGALPQINTYNKSWIDFFIHCRLQPQIKLAEQKSLLQSKHFAAFEHLYIRLPSVFEEEKPSLLHGDLWSGNFICNEDAQPALIDPAVYFGHRSMDLAMTTLFGGFDKVFYESYNYHFPFPANHVEQWEICNLYPLLIHLNLFGAGYLNQIEIVLKKFN